MTATDGPQTGGLEAAGTPEEIEAHIAQTREQLAETVDALGAKLDVRARATEKAADLRASLTDADGRPTGTAWGAVAATAGLLAAAVWRRSRR
jgi:uncharacterized protein DUF3618